MSQSDRLLIKDLHLRGIIGLNDDERVKRQDILVNIALETDVSEAGRTDSADGIVNYKSVTKDVIEYGESSKHFLVEALATEIARICVVGHGATRATVRVEKPGAVRFARSVGVEITRERADFDG